MAKTLFIIARQGFRDEEYEIPKRLLEQAGHSVVTASTAVGTAIGKLGLKTRVDLALCDLVIEDYACVVLVGGPGSTQFWDDKFVHSLLRHAAAKGLIVAAICSAAVTLAKSGILSGRRATVFPGDADVFRPLVGTYTAVSCEIDGRYVTADGPKSADAFGQALVRLLGR